jgi:hypothetical protein
MSLVSPTTFRSQSLGSFAVLYGALDIVSVQYSYSLTDRREDGVITVTEVSRILKLAYQGRTQ